MPRATCSRPTGAAVWPTCVPTAASGCIAGPGPDGLALKPNGIALLRDGSFLLTHLGNDEGGVFRLQRDGQVAPWLMRVDGVDLPPTNFVVEDAAGRFWVTVSTRLKPRALGYRRSCNDGFIVRVDARGAAIVADGLGYTNEVAVHPSGQWLYVNETFARRLSRFALREDGSLGAKEVVTEFGPGTFPDGLAFDEEGHAWVVSIVSNRLIRVAPDGGQTLVAGRSRRRAPGLGRGGLRSRHDGPAAPGRRAGEGAAQHLQHRLCRARPAHRRARLPARRSPGHAAPAGGRRRTHALELCMNATRSQPSASLVDAAYEQVRRRILDNVWPPGHRALEQEVALALGMSRTPVREALMRLQQEGLVEVIPRHGMRVLPVSPTDMREIYQILTALECMAAELLAQRKPGDKELKPLVDATKAMDKALKAEDLDAWAAADERFHAHLVELAGNRQLQATVLNYWDRAHRARMFTLRLRPKPVNSTKEHMQMVERLLRRRRRRRRGGDTRPPRARQPRAGGDLRALQAGADVKAR